MNKSTNDIQGNDANAVLDEVHIGFAVHSLPLVDQPLYRFDNIEDARAELTNNDDVAIIVTEVSERQKNGSLLIKEKRVLSAPTCWIKADDFSPEYDGRYLAHIVTKEECGNFTKRLEVVYFGYAKWSIKEKERITHWMIVLPPDRTVTLL